MLGGSREARTARRGLAANFPPLLSSERAFPVVHLAQAGSQSRKIGRLGVVDRWMVREADRLKFLVAEKALFELAWDRHCCVSIEIDRGSREGSAPTAVQSNANHRWPHGGQRRRKLLSAQIQAQCSASEREASCSAWFMERLLLQIGGSNLRLCSSLGKRTVGGFCSTAGYEDQLDFCFT
jgi:hypothetical protein